MVYVDEQIKTRAETIDHLISRLMNVLMLLRIELFFVFCDLVEVKGDI